MPFSKSFRPKAPADLIRVGSPEDGGYVLSERVLDATGGLVSMGLCDDWTFEKDVADRTGAPFVVFDHSVGLKFWIRRALGSTYHGLRTFDFSKIARSFRFVDYIRYFDDQKHRHVKKAIGRTEHGFVSLEHAIEIAGFDSDLLLKIDIEGAEYRILDQIVEHRNRFCGIVMELHEIDVHQEKIEQFLKAMDEQFLLCHFHANNCTTYGPDDFSIVVEISLMNRKLLEPGEKLVEHALPIAGLDAKNMPNAPDIIVRFD